MESLNEILKAFYLIAALSFINSINMGRTLSQLFMVDVANFLDFISYELPKENLGFKVDMLGLMQALLSVSLSSESALETKVHAAVSIVAVTVFCAT